MVSRTRAGGGETSFFLISRVTLWSPSLSVPSGGSSGWPLCAPCWWLLSGASVWRRIDLKMLRKHLFTGTRLLLAQPRPAAKTTRTHL